MEGSRSWIHNTEDMLLSEQEMEEKYNTIRLAIRTDGLTLKERMQHHKLQRDIVEINLHTEVDLLQSSILVIYLIIIPFQSVKPSQSFRCISFHL